jgi:hypothetical protein
VGAGRQGQPADGHFERLFRGGVEWADVAQASRGHWILRYANKMVVFDCAAAARLAGIAICGYWPGLSWFH